MAIYVTRSVLGGLSILGVCGILTVFAWRSLARRWKRVSLSIPQWKMENL